MIILKHKIFKKKYFQSPILRFVLKLLPNFVYIPLIYYLQTGNILSLKKPKTYCEKLQWLKLYGNYEVLSDYADKSQAKKIAEKSIGKEHIIPTLGIWNQFEDIDFASLPNQFVLKCTHDSGGNYVCQDKKSIPYKELEKFFKNRLNINYYWYLRESQYKNIVPRIIAEPLLSNGKNIVDYKFFCFNGFPKVLMVVHVVNGKKFSNYYDEQLNPIDVSMGNPSYMYDSTLPENINEMCEMARLLSSDLNHVRIDMYNINGNIYFGEYTFHHWSGMIDIQPLDFSVRLGEMIDCSCKQEKYEKLVKKQ